MSVLKIKRVRENAKLPFRATEGSAGMDLYACIEEPVVIAPNGTQKIPTGLSIELEDRNQVALIFARSSMGIKHSVTPANAVAYFCTIIRTWSTPFSHKTEWHRW